MKCSESIGLQVERCHRRVGERSAQRIDDRLDMGLWYGAEELQRDVDGLGTHPSQPAITCRVAQKVNRPAQGRLHVIRQFDGDK